MKKYVISLDRTPERYETFRQFNSHLTEVEKFSAIDGEAFNIDLKMLMADDLAYSPGAKGCALSHILLWKKCIDLGEPIIIMEDDAVTALDIEDHLASIKASSMAWELIVLGWNLDSLIGFELIPGIVRTQQIFHAPNIEGNLKKFQKWQQPRLGVKLEYCFGTPAYMITPQGAAKLIEMLLPLKNMTLKIHNNSMLNIGIDMALNSIYSQMNAYLSMPPLALTPNDKSSSTISVKK